MNTNRRRQSGEPAGEGRSHDRAPREAEAGRGAVSVVGGSMSGKGSDVTTGDLSGQTSGNGDSAGVRVAIVASKPGNAGGAKGGRKWSRKGKGGLARQRRSIAHWARTCAAEEPRGRHSIHRHRGERNRQGTSLSCLDLRCASVRWTPVKAESAKPRLESRMRESRTSGSEGGAAQLNAPSLPLSPRFSVRSTARQSAPRLRDFGPFLAPNRNPHDTGS